MKHLILTLLIVSTSMFMYSQQLDTLIMAKKQAEFYESQQPRERSWGEAIVVEGMSFILFSASPNKVGKWADELFALKMAGNLVKNPYVDKLITKVVIDGVETSLKMGGNKWGVFHIMEHIPKYNTIAGKTLFNVNSMDEVISLLHKFVKSSPKYLQTKGKSIGYTATIDGEKYILTVNKYTKDIISFYPIK